VWLDDQGNRMAFELIFPAEFADWAAAAENATQALNDFGFEITARGVQFQQQQQDVYDSNFQLAIRNWGSASPFPYLAYLEPYRRYNGQGELAGQEAGGGMKFDTKVTYSGGELDVLEATIDSSKGLESEAQNKIIEQLAISYNELLPAIPLWERYGNNPLNREFLTAPAGDDPIYKNAGLDHFMPYMIMTGKITPAGN
jgi:peptide/nickel transport system substrate-binding protein